MTLFNYLKLDLKISKNSFYLMIIIILFSFFSVNNNSLKLLFINAFPILMSGIPFSSTIAKNTTKMYHLFPSKISTMVLGRFLYIFSIFFFITIINIFLTIFVHINSSTYNIIFFEGISLIFCLINYTLNYSLNISYTFKDLFSTLFFFIFMLFYLVFINKNIINSLPKNNHMVLLILLFSIILLTVSSISFSIKNYKKHDIYD